MIILKGLCPYPMFSLGGDTSGFLFKTGGSMSYRIVLGLLVFSSIAGSAFAKIDYVDGYTRKDGTYVSGHFKDTSGDGNSYNNANTLGLN